MGLPGTPWKTQVGLAIGYYNQTQQTALINNPEPHLQKRKRRKVFECTVQLPHKASVLRVCYFPKIHQKFRAYCSNDEQQQHN